MTQRLSILGLVAAALGILSPPLLAHHGSAGVFAQTQTVTFTGTVTELRFNNPHVLLYFDVKTPEGETQRWTATLTAPTKLARGGWTKRTLEPGDQITISGRPHNGGAHVLQVRTLAGPDGKELPLREDDE